MTVRPLLRSAVLLLSALLAAADAHAQGARCTLVDAPNRTVNITNRGTDFETWYITDAVIDCPDGRHLVARHATYSVAAGMITLTGAVRVEDPDQILESEYAQYFSETRQLHARSAVVLTERETGSVIRSEQLDVYEQSPERPEGLVIATGGEPRAVIYRTTETVERDSTIIDAREIRIIGEQSFRGSGEAVMRRDSLTARGNVIEYSEQQRQLDVMGAAHVVTPGQELRGDSITATLDEADQIRDVLARRAASLAAEDLNVTAPAIRLFFQDGAASRLVAMEWDSIAARGGARPLVVSDQFRLDADSIDALAPEQRIEDAVAIGNAYGERTLPDSLRALLPEAPEEIVALLARDWVRGDTVRARFAPNPAAATDTTADPTVMEQLTAHGNQAQSMYSIRDEEQPEAKLAFNYLRSTYIEVNFTDGLVSTVIADGDARGVYVQPADAARTRRDGQDAPQTPPGTP